MSKKPHIYMGLQLSRGNAKTGPSFSLPEGSTCPGKTARCISACYAGHGRMNLAPSRSVRARNHKRVLELLAAGQINSSISELIKGSGTATVRVHDVGDFFTPAYVGAWINAAVNNGGVEFWAYTRSWASAPLLPYLKQLAMLQNFALWLSCDGDNWLGALATYKANPGTFAGIAFMQQSDTEEISEILAKSLPAANLVIFPEHGHFGKIKSAVNAAVPNCPAITHSLPPSPLPACLACRKCLPNQEIA